MTVHGHNVLLAGSLGSGKTLLARALPGILPEMSIDESLDVTRIYSVADQLPAGMPLIRHRPFCAPHHTISHDGSSNAVSNARMRAGDIRQYCQLPEEGQSLMRAATYTARHCAVHEPAQVISVGISSYPEASAHDCRSSGE